MFQQCCVKRKNHSNNGKVPKPMVVALILCQHILLWSCLCVVAGSVYILVEIETNGSILAAILLMLIGACVSIICVCLHNAQSYLLTKPPPESRDRLKHRLRLLPTVCLCMSVVIWLVAFGFGATFILVRQPSCAVQQRFSKTDINIGIACYVGRGNVAASFLALITSCTLLALVRQVREAARYHLFGEIEHHTTLPLMLPFRTSTERPMFSELSFKCRSSTSMSSKTLVHSSSDSSITLLPDKPDKDGLGIYAASRPSFLAPRPSLSSIRSYAETISANPPASPLPPLPAHVSKHSHKRSELRDAVRLPRYPSRYHRLPKEHTLRIVPPSPVLAPSNLRRSNQSQISLTSVYSQDMTGKRHSIGFDHHFDLLDHRAGVQKTTSANQITNGLVQAPKPMNLTRDFSSLAIAPASQSMHQKSESIDDATTLQARLPTVRAVSVFGDVEKWSCGSQTAANYYKRLIEPDQGSFRRQLSLKPLMMRKTRDSAAAKSMA